MKKIVLAWLVFASLASAGPCLAAPSSSFQMRNGERYDNWNLCRTRSWGADGFFQVTDTNFRPAIAFESIGEIGEFKDIAWEIGERLARQYTGNELAERIFAFARDHVTYTSDAIQFGSGEFARNADEMAMEIESNGSSRGDCEDYAVLLTVMFRAAGLRSAVVLAPGHAAALVHLPDYPGANTYWEFKGEGGWVWAEATGRNNPLGWTPPDFMRSDLNAYEISDENIFAAGTSSVLVTSGGDGIFFGGSSFFSMFLLLWLLSAFRRR